MRYLFWLKLWVSETSLIWFTNCFFSFKFVLLFHVGPSRFFTGNEIPRSFLCHSSRGKFSKRKCGIKALYRESPRSSQCHECYHRWPREFGWVKKLERMLFIPMRRGSYRYICLPLNEGWNEMSKLIHSPNSNSFDNIEKEIILMHTYKSAMFEHLLLVSNRHFSRVDFVFPIQVMWRYLGGFNLCCAL